MIVPGLGDSLTAVYVTVSLNVLMLRIQQDLKYDKRITAVYLCTITEPSNASDRLQGGLKYFLLENAILNKQTIYRVRQNKVAP